MWTPPNDGCKTTSVLSSTAPAAWGHPPSTTPDDCSGRWVQGAFAEDAQCQGTQEKKQGLQICFQDLAWVPNE